MKRHFGLIATTLAGMMVWTSVVAPSMARASEEGKKNTAIALGVGAAVLLLTQKNKTAGIVTAIGAAAAYKSYDDDVKARHRREQERDQYYRRERYRDNNGVYRYKDNNRPCEDDRYSDRNRNRERDRDQWDRDDDRDRWNGDTRYRDNDPRYRDENRRYRDDDESEYRYHASNRNRQNDCDDNDTNYKNRRRAQSRQEEEFNGTRVARLKTGERDRVFSPANTSSAERLNRRRSERP
jgi:hypothetical protein